MNRILLIAADEWRYWRRSKLAAAVLALGVLVTAASVAVTGGRMAEAAHERSHLQETAEDAFLAQPDRHPHRMVHYGHYVFRAPPPLSAVDPGVDAFTGTSIFLEGHRQNTAMFAERRQSAGLALGEFTPAFALQVFAPLLLILIGYGAIAREREARTLALLQSQGVSMSAVMAGKGLALLAAGALTLAPLVLAAIVAATVGEAATVALVFIAAYGLYLAVWCGAVVAASCAFAKPNASLAALLGLWAIVILVTPRIAAATAAGAVAAPGKIETDFAVAAAMKEVGDGHNATDPAFEKLKANLLTQYDVDRVEDLPVNIRGVVAGDAETKLTDIMNRFAEDRMTREATQADFARAFGWASPMLAIRDAAAALAGVDLETHHRFLREAERVRFDFVQGLNKVHAENLAYVDDIRRGSDAAAEKRARVSAENWKVLEDFRFEPAAPSERIARAGGPLAMLAVWIAALGAACAVIARRAP